MIIAHYIVRTLRKGLGVMKEKLQKFFAGSYGSDGLNRFLTIIALAIYILAIITKWPWIALLAMLLLILVIFRMLSKNIQKRSLEYQRFRKIKAKLIKPFSNLKIRYQQRHTHKFYRCPKCHQSLRVPKGLGELSISCPKCKTTFSKKT